MTGYGTEYGSLYSVDEIGTYANVRREQIRYSEAEAETQSTVQATEEFVSERPPTPTVSDASVVVIPPDYIPLDFGSPSDTAWFLLRQNLGICEENGVCPLDIENLLRNAISRQSDYPEMSKTDVIGCLCPDGKCRPLPPMGASSIKVVVNCLECEDDCPICLCPMEDEMGCITSCSHIFHRSCFFKIKEDPWGNWKRCPLCRNRLSARSAVGTANGIELAQMVLVAV
jgi:hypothetical protein